MIELDELMSLALAAFGFGVLAACLYFSTAEKMRSGFRVWPASAEGWVGYVGRSALLLSLVLVYGSQSLGEGWFSLKLPVSKWLLLQSAIWLLTAVAPFCWWRQRRIFVYILLVFVWLVLVFPALATMRE